MSRLFKRSDNRDLCDVNVTVLTLAEAVQRWTRDGQFLMTEVNGSDSYMAKDTNIPMDSYSPSIGKIDAALAGMDFVKEVKAPVTELPVASAPPDVPAPPVAPPADGE